MIWNIGKDTTTIYHEGEPFTVATTPDLIEAIKNNDVDAVMRLVRPSLSVKSAFLQYGDVRVQGRTITFRGRPINNGSVQRVIELLDMGAPIDSEVMCLDSLMLHDDARVIESFEDYIQRWRIPRTKQGAIVLCKGVRGDFSDTHSGTVNWKPGASVPVLSWNDVDRDPNNTCSRGYHAAPLEGARQYATGGKLIEVAVMPHLIAAFPIDYKSNGKIRACHMVSIREIPPHVAAVYGHGPIVHDYQVTPSSVCDPGNDDLDDDDYF